MKFLIMIHYDQDAAMQAPADAREALTADHLALWEELEAAGVVRAGSAQLAPAAEAAYVSAGPDGVLTVTDGPYADAREQLGGIYTIETGTREEALDWARRVPFSPDAEGRPQGAVELRPIV